MNTTRTFIYALVALPLSAIADVSPQSPGCWMAHCDPQMSGLTLSTVPMSSSTVTSVRGNGGSGQGLGCSANQNVQIGGTGPRKTLVACTFNNTASGAVNLRVYNGDGGFIFDDSVDSVGQHLTAKASYSAPIVFEDGRILAVDDTKIELFVFQASTGRWTGFAADLKDNSGNPLPGIPTSPVMVNKNIVFLATETTLFGLKASVSTWDISNINGAPVFKSSWTSTVTNNFETSNTPTVDQTRSRVYVVMSKILSPNKGRLQAFDINADGTLKSGGPAAWYFDNVGTGAGSLSGNAGSSPLLIKSGNTNQIFFDSFDTDAKVGHFYGVTDDGSNTSTPPFWHRDDFPNARFLAAAAQDPRNDVIDGSGTFWIFPTPNPLLTNIPLTTCTSMPAPTPATLNCLIRLRASDGITVQGDGNNSSQTWVDIGQLLPSPVTNNNSYHFGPSSAITVSHTTGGDVALTMGTASAFSKPSYAVSLDVSLVASPTAGGAHLIWYAPVDPDGNTASDDWAAGQFPIAISTQGTPRTVFTSQHNGPFFVGP